ncbi:MAG: PEP-CTERM sorting domain-containing protein, partial [Gemmataceae bacterium]|nr:PEP-CTERM sorting domain-containing protein [Gemmataceae bacterium]
GGSVVKSLGRSSWGCGRLAGAACVLLAASAEARAFYWFDWPGSRVPQPPSLLPPGHTPPSTPDTPPGDNPRIPETPEQPVGPPVPVDKTPIGPPHRTPEPSALVLGAIGLGVFALRRWRR